MNESFLFKADELDLFGRSLNWEQALKAPRFLDGDPCNMTSQEPASGGALSRAFSMWQASMV